MSNEISQPVARAMQAALRKASDAWRVNCGSISFEDMKAIRYALDLCAREDGQFLYQRDFDFLAKFEDAPHAVAAE